MILFLRGPERLFIAGVNSSKQIGERLRLETDHEMALSSFVACKGLSTLVELVWVVVVMTTFVSGSFSSLLEREDMAASVRLASMVANVESQQTELCFL